MAQLVRKIALVLIAVEMTAMGVYSQIPSGYYNSVNGKNGDAVLTALNAMIRNHTVVNYKNLEDYYERTDFADGYVWDIYSTCLFTMAQANKTQKRVCDAWNKEHTVPQSWFNERSPMKSDLFHVLPTDARVNNFRGNLPYGETNNTDYVDDDPKALGALGVSSFSGYNGKVYEPDDQYKGDIARIYFYMVARYRENALNQSSGSIMFTSVPTNLTSYSIALLMKWHREDPVSQKEIDRNDAVYAIQHNRNPFVDYPYLAEYVWGNRKGERVEMAHLLSSSNKDFIPGESDGWSDTMTDLIEVREVTEEESGATEGKYIADGQLYIVFEGKSYNTLGQEVIR